jgi:hypothetical protein
MKSNTNVNKSQAKLYIGNYGYDHNKRKVDEELHQLERLYREMVAQYPDVLLTVLPWNEDIYKEQRKDFVSLMLGDLAASTSPIVAKLGKEQGEVFDKAVLPLCNFLTDSKITQDMAEIEAESGDLILRPDVLNSEAYKAQFDVYASTPQAVELKGAIDALLDAVEVVHRYEPYLVKVGGADYAPIMRERLTDLLYSVERKTSLSF